MTKFRSHLGRTRENPETLNEHYSVTERSENADLASAYLKKWNVEDTDEDQEEAQRFTRTDKFPEHSACMVTVASFVRPLSLFDGV